MGPEFIESRGKLKDALSRDSEKQLRILETTYDCSKDSLCFYFQLLMSEGLHDLDRVETASGHTKNELEAISQTAEELRGHINRLNKTPVVHPINDTVSETLSKLPSRIGRGFVFPPNLSKPDVPYTDLNKTFRRLMSRAEIENVRFHDLRHTYASHLIMNGVDISTVKELLGHSDIKMTERYCHVSPGHKARAVKILDTAFHRVQQCFTTRIRWNVQCRVESVKFKHVVVIARTCRRSRSEVVSTADS